jgi:hypothetical protein
MAEGVGFEPTVQLPVHGISSAAPSATRPPLLVGCWLHPDRGPGKMAEGRGFEPPRDSRPYPISSRTPSTGLGHPSASMLSIVYRVFLSSAPSGRRRVPQRPERAQRNPQRSSRRPRPGGPARDACAAVPCSRQAIHRVPWTVRKSTPAVIKREAPVCRNASSRPLSSALRSGGSGAPGSGGQVLLGLLAVPLRHRLPAIGHVQHAIVIEPVIDRAPPRGS